MAWGLGWEPGEKAGHTWAVVPGGRASPTRLPCAPGLRWPRHHLLLTTFLCGGGEGEVTSPSHKGERESPDIADAWPAGEIHHLKGNPICLQTGQAVCSRCL